MASSETRSCACPHCGQLVACKLYPGESAEAAAERECDCAGARTARERRKRIQNSRELLHDLFGDPCGEIYGMQPVDSEVLETLKSVAVLIIDGKLGSISMDIPRAGKATIRLGRKGGICAKRSQTRAIERAED